MPKDNVKIEIKIDTSPFQKGLMTVLRGLYQIEKSPYGDTNEGFQKWLAERAKENQQIEK